MCYGFYDYFRMVRASTSGVQRFNKRGIMKNLKLLTASFAVLSLAGCGGSTHTGMESYKVYGEKVEDVKIINKIRAEFRTNSAIPHNLIHVSIDRGIVQLSGFVHSHREADLAIMTTRAIPEVKDVINSMVVMSGSDYAVRRGGAEAGAASR